MKNILILLIFPMMILGSCRDQKTETKEVIREVHVEKTEEAPPREGALEKAAQKIDDKVNEEIDETIDQID